MDNRIVPYEGNEPYLFVSFCRGDADFVYPMIRDLIANGYRVWYDAGIRTGDNRPEIAANHLHDSKICLAVISEASVDSHHCKNEINLALEQKIKLLPIIHTDFETTLGMRLLFDSTQYIREYEYQTEEPSGAEAFFRDLLAAEPCRACRKKEFWGKPFRVGPRTAQKPGNQEETCAEKAETRFAVLIDIRSGEIHRLSETVSIGRDRENRICLPDETKTIGRRHAEIRTGSGKKTTISDLRSVNGTFVCGKRMDTGSTVSLNDYSMVSIAGRELLYLENDSARAAVEERKLAVLKSAETTDRIVLTPHYVLGRTNPWPSGLFGPNDSARQYLSREHGSFEPNGDGFCLAAGLHVTNGTFLNGQKLTPGQRTETLREGDVIDAAGKHTFRYGFIKLWEGEHEEV